MISSDIFVTIINSYNSKMGNKTSKVEEINFKLLEKIAERAREKTMDGRLSVENTTVKIFTGDEDNENISYSINNYDNMDYISLLDFVTLYGMRKSPWMVLKKKG